VGAGFGMHRNFQSVSWAEHPACARVRAAVAAEAEQLTQTLVAWADINTGSENLAGLEQLAGVIQLYAEFLPVESEWLVDHVNGARCGLRWRMTGDGSGPSVLLNGHLDTVYGLEHPFQRCTVQLEQDRLHGPGVADMKGGLLILFAAVKAWLNSGLADQLSWEILLTFDEEVGSFQNTVHLQEAARRHDLGITFESSLPDGSLVRNRMGTGLVSVRAQGRAAHAGRDFAAGRNAITALSRFVDQAQALNGTVPDVIINTGRISGGGPTNVVPDFAEALINVRACTPGGEVAVMDGLRAIAAAVSRESGCKLEVDGGFTRPAKVANPAVELLMETWQQCGAAMGMELDWRDTGGASDGNTLQAAGLPIVDNLGAVGDLIHNPGEYVRLSSLVERAQLVAGFLVNLAGGRFDVGDQSFVNRLRAEKRRP
jgi:glutamate carboxypeptidase